MNNPRLWTAVSENKFATVCHWLEAHTENLQEKGGADHSTALQLAVTARRSPDMVEKLLSHSPWRIDVNELFNGQTLLHEVMLDPNMPLAELLLKYGANTEKEDSLGETPLHAAATVAEGEFFVLLLLDWRANINARKTRDNLRGATPLILAAFHGITDMVILLVNKDADISLQDQWGRTAEEVARQHNYTAIRDYLGKKRKAREQIG